MSIVFVLWAWFFSNLYIEPEPIFLLTISLVCTMITIDIWRLSNWIYRRNQ